MSRRSSADAAGALKKLIPDAPNPGCGRSIRLFNAVIESWSPGFGNVSPGGNGTPSSVASIMLRIN